MNREVARHILELLETMDEGVLYVKGKIETLEIEQTITMLADLIAAFNEIERNIDFEIMQLAYPLIKKTQKLKRAFNHLVTDYENTGGQKAYEVMQLKLEPSYNQWKHELIETLTPLRLS